MNSTQIIEAREDHTSTLHLRWIILFICICNIAISFLYFEVSNTQEIRLKSVAVTLFACGVVHACISIRKMRKIPPESFEGKVLFSTAFNLIAWILLTFLYLFMALGMISIPF